MSNILAPASLSSEVTELHNAGLDWTGTPDAPSGQGSREFYGPGLVLVPTAYPIEQNLAQWRVELGFEKRYEFHGYELRKISRGPEIMARFLSMVEQEFRCIVLLFDKRELSSQYGPSVFEKAQHLAPATGLQAAEYALTMGNIPLMEYDAGDIQHSEIRKHFRIAVKHLVRDRTAIRPDVRPRPSHLSALVQFADVISYVVRRDEEGLSETAELRRLMRKLRRKSDCLISSGNQDDLQSYLKQ